ncbi:MAG TPA: beta-lactamase family protein [Firmicutes bacterium]|jgi:CubicO group peptidase (beta-lactamase class C family)|nr:beta-lactamase family protein [Bacillota bacterium]
MVPENSTCKARWSKFEEHTKELMKERHIAGAAVAVSKNGQVVYAKGFGVRDMSTCEQVNPETIFGIASVSKSLTALAIMQLQDEGMLSVDDPVTKYIPELKLPGLDDMGAVKIRHLLSHTTGVPPMRRRQELIRFKEHLDFFETEKYSLLGKPGEYFSYCNDVFLLLGLIIERLTGKPYTRHMTVNFLDTLGMNRSTYALEELAKFENVAVPYIYNDKTGSLEEVKWPRLGNYEVGGGVRSNVLDLMKYAQVYVNQGTANGQRIVSPDSIRQMQNPVYKIARNNYYGFALKITPDYSGVTLVEHGGGQPGVSSNFGFVPEANLAVAVLTNVSDVPAESIWLTALNTALGLPIDLKRSHEPHYSMSSEDMASFCGTYQSDEGSEFRIIKSQDGFRITVLDNEYALRASSENTLVFDKNGSEQVIRFYFDKTGKPWAAFFHLRMLRKVSD